MGTFRFKSDLRDHQAIVQPRLYDSLMVTQITLHRCHCGTDRDAMRPAAAAQLAPSRRGRARRAGPIPACPPRGLKQPLSHMIFVKLMANIFEVLTDQCLASPRAATSVVQLTLL